MNPIVASFQNLLVQAAGNPLATLLLLGSLLVIVLLFYAQTRKDKFDLRYLVCDPKTKQPSIHVLGHFTALVISSWGFIVLTEHGQLTELYFTTYMAVWAAANATNKYLSLRDDRERDNQRFNSQNQPPVNPPPSV